MKILFDYQIFSVQKFGGISRYFVELLSRFPETMEFKNSIVFSDNVYLKNTDSRFSKGIEIPHFKGRNRLQGYLNKLKSISDLNINSYDLFHPTYYNPYFLRYLKRPYVITVYDMIHEKFSEMFSSNDPMRDYKKETIVKADKVIAISHKTKEDIIDIYGLPENRIEVVHLGHSVDNRFATPIDGIPNKYILFVGQRGGYKNFERFIKAYALIHKDFPEIKLVCTGASFKPSEECLMKSLGIQKDVFRYFVSDSQLTFLYRNALCFVYPSLYEGFGIPILEAFASQCPLALSNTSCFPEIAREGGAYFNPYDIDDIAKTLNKIISDEIFRKNLVIQGNKVLPLYSWDKMAKETFKIYRDFMR